MNGISTDHMSILFQSRRQINFWFYGIEEECVMNDTKKLLEFTTMNRKKGIVKNYKKTLII
jgi:hypothetical protein